MPLKAHASSAVGAKNRWVAPCFPWFLSFGNRTQNSRVAGASPTTSPSGDLIPTMMGSGARPGGAGTREEPGTLTQGGALFSLVPLFWESNPKLQGGWCKPNHQPIGGSDPNHEGIWSPPRAGLPWIGENVPGNLNSSSYHRGRAAGGFGWHGAAVLVIARTQHGRFGFVVDCMLMRRCSRTSECAWVPMTQ